MGYKQSLVEKIYGADMF